MKVRDIILLLALAVPVVAVDMLDKGGWPAGVLLSIFEALNWYSLKIGYVTYRGRRIHRSEHPLQFAACMMFGNVIAALIVIAALFE